MEGVANNRIILETIFQWCDIPQLLSLRLVCRLWNQEACRKLERRMTLTFSRPQQLARYNEIFSNHQVVNYNGLSSTSTKFTLELFSRAIAENMVDGLREGLQEFAEAKGNQTRQLMATIHPYFPVAGDFTLSTYMFEELHKIVFERFVQIEKLTLEFNVSGSCIPDNFSIAESAIFAPWTPLPQIKSVTFRLIRDDRVPSSYEADLVGQLIETIVVSASNIEEFYAPTLWFNDRPSPIMSNRIMASLARTLQTLHLGEPLSGAHLETLTVRNFPRLENIDSIMLDAKTIAPETIAGFFLQYKDTFRNLNLCFKSKTKQFPRLPPSGIVLRQIKKLGLENYEGEIISQNLPQIRRLSMGECKMLRDPFSANYGGLCNLTFLDLGNVDAHFLQTIFQDCLNTQSLRITNCRNVSDEAICGVPRFHHELMQHYIQISETVKDNADKVAAAIALSRSIEERGPYIGDLKDLSSLTMVGRFSDLAVLFGIVNCNTLKNLHLVSSRLTRRGRLVVEFGMPDLVEKNLFRKLGQPVDF